MTQFLRKAVIASAVAMAFGGSAIAQTALSVGSSLSNAANVLQNSDPTTPWIATLAWESFQDTTSAPPPNFYGIVGTWVSNTDALNPYGAGALTFLYQFQNCNGGFLCGEGVVSTDAINRWTLTGFSGYQTSVAYTDQWSYTDMLSVDRFGGTGNGIGVNFSGVAPGGVANLVVYTNAYSYSTNVAFFQDGGQGVGNIFAPVPEPETYAMLLAGLGLMGFVARRRKQKLAAA